MTVTLPVHRQVQCVLWMAEVRSVTPVQSEYFACLTNHRQLNIPRWYKACKEDREFTGHETCGKVAC